MEATSAVLEILSVSARPGSRVSNEDGLTWWNDGLQQRIQLETMTSTRGVSHTRIKLCTDLVDGFDGSDEQLKILDLLVRYAGVSGIVRSDSDPARLQLIAAFCYKSSRSAHGTMVAQWLPGFQMAEAHAAVPLLEEMAGFTKAVTEPPATAETDESGRMWDTSQLPFSTNPSYWANLEGTLGLIKRSGLCLLGTADEENLVAEFPFPGKPGSSLLRMSTTERHPRLGAGLLVRLTLPMDEPERPSVEQVLALNAKEASGFTTVFGSWCRSDEGLTHVTFLPNVLRSDISITDVVESTLHRVEWIMRYLFDYDVHEHFEEALEQKAAVTNQFVRGMEESDHDPNEIPGSSSRPTRSPYIKKTFHERVAEKAIRDGNTPAQFRAAAQRHANAFWIWVALGGAVWFIFGFWWALIPLAVALFKTAQSVSSTLVAQKLEDREPLERTDDNLSPMHAQRHSDAPMDLEEINQVRSAFADLMENDTSPYAECMYKPAELLPYPKPVIAEALSTLLEAANEGDNSRIVFEEPQEAVRVLRMGLYYLDHFLEVPADDLPTDPVANVRFGRSWKQDRTAT